jgi:archaellum biogenesis protein FlaJ (TadC family)
MQMSIDKIIEPINNCIENFNYAKNSVAEILNIKSSYNINDIKNIILELSFINDITIDLVILD